VFPSKLVSARSCVLVVGALLVAACSDVPLPNQPGATTSGPRTLAAVAQDPTPDFLEVARVVPGFAGYYLDAAGAPTVRLTDPARRPEAEAALAGFLADRGFSASDLRVVQSTYDYLQLDAWYNQSWGHALSVSGAVYSDIDESNNGLRFGAVDAAAAAQVTSVVEGAGVPAAAFSVVVAAPVENMHTLRDRVRPVHGGYQINFFPSPVSPVSLVCTMGFNVVKNGVNSFITNSHCSNVQGGTETPTDYYQPLRGTPPNPNNFIGVEVEDPHYEVVNCTQDFEIPAQCRYSDASRAQYASGVPFDLGHIARTTTSYQDTPRGEPDITGARARVPVLEVDPANPTFAISGEQKRSVLGETVNKVGRTTGWTVGPVIQTCINTLVLGTVPPIIQRCQDRVRADVAGGDSGSPVFRVLGGSGKVRLAGILWGGSVSGTVTYVFSPMANVHRELGDFITH
jgi:hypothetical protein